MSKALEGEHYCEKHQGNHSYYAKENCTVCKLQSALTAQQSQEPPKWYTRNEIIHILRRMKYSDEIAQELADWIVRHLRRTGRPAKSWRRHTVPKMQYG